MQYAESFFIAKDEAWLASASPSQRSASMASYEVVLDPSDYKRWRTALKLSWHQNASFMLPNFMGTLTARSESVRSKLTPTGSCDRLPVEKNASLDMIALAIARAATRALLQQIALHCEEEWISFANGCPTVAMCNERSAALAQRYA